ncbi:hypothetical protein GIB67_038425 [Kingdonia uniflora]|uniref:Stress-induced protein n=1 Tax=Kingdonia uniflora TaxID=39325 RepID=A0A7J7NPS2_9MAGN|nr:hypothetical protein GIB67_038425 [Kingdonia uniflora]
MDPQVFVRLSIGSLGLRIPPTALKNVPEGIQAPSSLCSCEFRLRGFPVQTTSIPFILSPESAPDLHSIASSFYLEKSDVKALLAPRCFNKSHACLEVFVFITRQTPHCEFRNKKQRIGTFKLPVGPEWAEGKPVVLHNGWIGVEKNKKKCGKLGAELHLKVKLDPDPRYVFQFEDETTLNPQIVLLEGTIKQPIFSCKFSRDRRASQLDPMNSYWSSFSGGGGTEQEKSERRERKGWKVMIHDLSGSAVAAAFISTPFVPSTGCDRVLRSNPGAWMIVRPDPYGLDSWQPWGKLEAWRESGARDNICCRFNLHSEGQVGGSCLLVSEMFIRADKGGEFFIDSDRPTPNGTPVPSPHSSGDFAAIGPSIAGGFVMNCRVQGERKSSKPLVQLATRHVRCVEDAAIFMALAAAVDLSIEACRPFERKARRKSRDSLII